MKLLNKLGLFTKHQLNDAVWKKEKEFLNEIKQSIYKLRDWRRGMSMQCKDVDIINKADKQIQKVIQRVDFPVENVVRKRREFVPSTKKTKRERRRNVQSIFKK